MANQRRFVPSSRTTKAGDRNALVVLSWGSVARYRRFPLKMTIGELRRQLARELGRLFDGEVVGLELFSTGTNVRPNLALPLQELTYPPYRNVCLDVTGGPDRRKKVTKSDTFPQELLKQSRDARKAYFTNFTIAEGDSTVTESHLSKTAPSLAKATKMALDNLDGEKELEESKSTLALLRQSLGLDAGPGLDRNKADDEHSQNTKKQRTRHLRRAGQRNPKRDPVGQPMLQQLGAM